MTECQADQSCRDLCVALTEQAPEIRCPCKRDAGTGLRTMLRHIGADEHHNRNERLARLCGEAWEVGA